MTSYGYFSPVEKRRQHWHICLINSISKYLSISEVQTIKKAVHYTYMHLQSRVCYFLSIYTRYLNKHPFFLSPPTAAGRSKHTSSIFFGTKPRETPLAPILKLESCQHKACQAYQSQVANRLASELQSAQPPCTRPAAARNSKGEKKSS